MKRLMLIISMLLLILVPSGCARKPGDQTNLTIPPKPTTPWDIIVQKGEIRIGVPTTNDSMDNRLIDAFSQETDLKVEKVVLPWDSTLQDALQDGSVDMLWGQIPATSDSSTMFRLSNPYFHSKILYLSNKEDLVLEQSTTVGVQKHTAEQFMAENYYTSVSVYQSKEELFSALSQKKVDCILLDNGLFQNMQIKKDAFHIVKEVPYDLVVAFKHNNVTVASEVEKAIAKIKADGTASKICLQWYLNDYIAK